MRINTSSWREFSFNKIFKIRKGFYNKRPEEIVVGKIPFLGATAKNNGITGYYSLSDIEKSSKAGDNKNAPLSEKIYPGNALCVTNNGSVGYAYFQKDEFTCSHDVNPLYILDGEFNEYTALFVATIIHQDRYRWAYGRKWRPERMELSTILLPSTNDEKPDWDFMERFVKTLKYKHISTNINCTKKVILENYKEYSLEEIFRVEYGVNLELNSCDETNSDDVDAVNFVSRSKDNNGVTAYIKRIPNIKPQKAGIITVAGGGSSVLSTFVQTSPFYSGRDLYLLIPHDEMSIYSKLFLCTLIMANKYKYSFGRQANKTLPKIKLMIPSLEDKKINYDLIDSYMKSLPYSDRV